MLAVVVSRSDSASEHIGDHILELGEWTERDDRTRPAADGGGTYYRDDGIELRTFAELHLHLEDVADAFDDPDLLVFVSRHSGETGPLLSAHTSGNFGEAAFGGRDRSLPQTAPNALRVARAALDEHAPDGYETGIECTHHGPSSVGCPSLFVELGSGQRQWTDPEGAAAVARSILALADVDARGDRTVVGFGGDHYARRFDRVLEETDWAIGHVAADWCLDDVGDPREAREVVEAAFRASDATRALFDGDHDSLGTLAEVIEALGFEVVSETWLRETTGVPLSFVAEAERQLRPVEAGLRFGEPAAGFDGSFVVEDLPLELLSVADGLDSDRTRSIVEERALAYETTENGTCVDGTVALQTRRDRRAIAETLTEVLESKYDSIEVGREAVVARRVAFDPELAREAGIGEGPAFGRLSAGEPVEIDGDVVEPADVRSARERRFPL